MFEWPRGSEEEVISLEARVAVCCLTWVPGSRHWFFPRVSRALQLQDAFPFVQVLLYFFHFHTCLVLLAPPASRSAPRSPLSPPLIPVKPVLLIFTSFLLYHLYCCLLKYPFPPLFRGWVGGGGEKRLLHRLAWNSVQHCFCPLLWNTVVMGRATKPGI